MSNLTLTRTWARAHSSVAALVCALLLPACGSDSPDVSAAPGSGGSGGSAGSAGMSGGQPTGSGGSDSMVDAGVVPPEEDAGTTPDPQPTTDAGDKADVAADVGGGDGSKPGTADGGVLNPTVVQMMRKVADWQLPSAGGSKDWIHGAMWTGIMATYTATKDEKYLTAIKNWAGAGWGLDGGNGARGDNQCAAQTFFDAYLADPTPANMVRLTGAKGSFDALVANTPQGRVEWWWEDALFMVPPGFARLGAATGDKKYFATMNAMYWDTYAFLFNAQAGLMYRDHRGSDGYFWARGNGWVIAGAARILQYLPADDPKRMDYINLIKAMSAALAKVQGADGLWRANLLNPAQYPGPETSGTGFFTFGMAWGINNGILDKATYLPVVQKGWDGLVKNVDAAGKLGYVQPVGAGPAASPQDSTVPYGVGAFLLAGSEMAKLLAP